ncbi:esterase [Herbaspirillum sp. meg3]|uniref:alpha/beta hydrolase n=1 Tax=Herbaspirillum sp. meg3 TaxID=2025949 RepID=UPI000B98B664|nr:alpha/beta hydrolase [Herbaspirillum sp. meg3]ASU38735.1 esterase [Herbaspirillum sp. meg3]
MSLSGKILMVVGVLILAGGSLVACSPLKVLNAVTPDAAYQKTADIPYGANPRQKLDIYVPREPAAGKAPPVVVFFYGGSWNDGSRKDYDFVGEALSSRGFIVVVADYRVYPEVKYPEFLKDSAQAVAWTLQHAGEYGGDLKRVFVMGHSAGAYNAAMVALDARWLKGAGVSPRQLCGWIGLAGPYDFLPIENADVKPVFWFPDSPLDSQPVRHVGDDSPAALLIASHKDKIVNAVRNTGGMAQLLRDHRVPVEEIYFDNTSHATLVASLSRPFRHLAPTLDRIADFIENTPSR